MSYCRFSSMNWMCDAYVYEDVSGGWTTHVARQRRVFPPIPDIDIRKVPAFGGKWDQATRSVVYPSRWRAKAAWLAFCIWSLWHRHVHLLSLSLIVMRRIGLPFDGETFSDPTPQECADRLVWLRGMGYTVPQGAIDALYAEK